MKKLWIVLLTAILFMAVTANAEEHTSGNYKYIIDESGNAVIVDYDDPDVNPATSSGTYRMTGDKPALVIPDNLDGHPVTAIGEAAFAGWLTFGEVIFPDSVVSIGDRAFDCCWELQKIILPDELKEIGEDAFSYTEIASFDIPASVVSIAGNPVEGCEKLMNIQVSEDNESYYDVQGVLFGKITETLIAYPCGRTESSYIVPEGTIVIGENAFTECRMESIRLPYSIRVIEPFAFSYSDNLELLSVPYTMSQVSPSAFSGVAEWFRFEIRSNFSMKEWAEVCEMDYEVITEISGD